MRPQNPVKALRTLYEPSVPLFVRKSSPPSCPSLLMGAVGLPDGPESPSLSAPSGAPGVRSLDPALPVPCEVLQWCHLGPTAIAPVHKKISVKARHDHSGDPRHSSMSSSSHMLQDGPQSLFDSAGLPVAALLPTFLDSFFRAYLGNMFFVSRRHLDSFMKSGEASVFLICAMSTLSSRFCPPEMFQGYLPPKADGSPRESWEYSIPILQQTKSMLIAAINLPSTDVVAGLLMLSLWRLW